MERDILANNGSTVPVANLREQEKKKRHRRTFAELERNFACEQCGRHYATEHSLNQHIRLKHAPQCHPNNSRRRAMSVPQVTATEMDQSAGTACVGQDTPQAYSTVTLSLPTPANQQRSPHRQARTSFESSPPAFSPRTPSRDTRTGLEAMAGHTASIGKQTSYIDVAAQELKQLCDHGTPSPFKSPQSPRHRISLPSASPHLSPYPSSPHLSPYATSPRRSSYSTSPHLSPYPTTPLVSRHTTSRQSSSSPCRTAPNATTSSLANDFIMAQPGSRSNTSTPTGWWSCNYAQNRQLSPSLPLCTDRDIDSYAVQSHALPANHLQVLSELSRLAIDDPATGYESGKSESPNPPAAYSDTTWCNPQASAYSGQSIKGEPVQRVAPEASVSYADMAHSAYSHTNLSNQLLEVAVPGVSPVADTFLPTESQNTIPLPSADWLLDVDALLANALTPDDNDTAQLAGLMGGNAGRPSWAANDVAASQWDGGMSSH